MIIRGSIMRRWLGIFLLVLLQISLSAGAELAASETISGDGEQISGSFPLSTGLAVFDIQHDGDDVYAVYLYDDDDTKITMLTVGSGLEDISTAFKIPESGNYYLNVTGNGSWEVSVSDPHNADIETVSPISGKDSQATLLYHFSAGQQVFDIRYTGNTNFIVEVLDTDGNYITILANAIDTWQGEKTITIPKEGDYLFDIECTGTWTISPVPAQTTDRENLSDTTPGDSDTPSPVTIEVSPVSFPAGSPFTISGSVQEIPDDGVAIWIIGDTATWYGTVPVDEDKTFMCEIGGDITGNLPAGDYSVIVEHPMDDGILAVFPDDYGFVSEIQRDADSEYILPAPGAEEKEMTRKDIVAGIDEAIMASDDDYAQVDIEITP